MRKTALTAYELIGTDWVRVTAAQLDNGSFAFVRADGSNSIVPILSDTFRTSGDIVNVASQLGHRVSMAAVPSVALPNHTWKGTYTLDEIAEKFGVSKSIVTALRATYTLDEAIAA